MSEEQRVQLINQQAAADLLGVSIHRIAKWLDRGMIPYVQIGKIRQIDKYALMEWYEGQIVYPDE